MRTVIGCLLLLLPAAGVARADQTDDFIKAQMKEQNIPGLSLVVLKDGEIIKSAGYGLANIQAKIPATPETVYLIGSIGKQFVATGIMLLVQEQALSLDDPISKHLEGTPPSWKAITIRHLLTHTAGLVRDPPGYDPLRIQHDADVIKATYRAPLRFAPGTKWEYSNAAFFPLADVIRKVTGRPWSEYITEKVFAPAGMSTTYPMNTTERLSNRARGYTDNNERREVRDWVAQHPAGGFLSTVLDLAKWDAMLDTDKLLSESSRRQMWTPVTLNDGSSYPYGLGWELDALDGRRQVRHGGSTAGWRAEFTRLVDDGLTIIILMNADDVDWQSIVRGVAAFYPPEAVR